MTLTEYVNSIKDKKIAVIGIGVSNTPLIRLLLSCGCDVTACDRRGIAELGMEGLSLINMGAKLKLGENYLEGLDHDIIFRTPGLMPFEPHLKAAVERGSILTSEMEAFFSLCPCRTVAVTGSDGKTTTSSIIAELLKKAGHTVHLGGNIGNPLLCDVPFFKKDDIAVLELSSFQLHSMVCKPDRAVVTNISPNHLDKHKDFQDYIDAKMSVFARQDENDLLVLCAEDGQTDYYESRAHSRITHFSGRASVQEGCYAENGVIYRVHKGERMEIMRTAEIKLPGEHNVLNFLAAFTVTDGLVSDEICREVAMHFAGVEHRLETVRVLRGVTYINDSIGSSPTRTIAGLHAIKRPIVIAGGYDKHIPFDTLGDELCLHAKSVFLTGDTAEKIRDAVLNSKYYDNSSIELYVNKDFRENVLAAAASAQEGDTVLFSPACASFDKFKNFSERGKYFKKIIMELT